MNRTKRLVLFSAKWMKGSCGSTTMMVGSTKGRVMMSNNHNNKYSMIVNNNNNKKYFSIKLNKLNIDPITSMAMEAEKHAPKNVKQIEERIDEIENQLTYNKDNLSNNTLSDIYKELSELYSNIYRYDKSEKAILQHLEYLNLIYGKDVNNKLIGDGYHFLSNIHVALDKLKSAYQHQSKCIEIKSKYFIEIQQNSKTIDKSEIKELTFDLANEWNYLGEIAMKLVNLQDAKKTFQKANKLFEQQIKPIYKKDERELRNEFEKMNNMNKPIIEIKEYANNLNNNKDFIEYKNQQNNLINIKELDKVPFGLIKVLNNLGNVCYRLKEYEEAYFTFYKAIQLEDKINEINKEESFELIGNIYLNMANCCLYLEMIDRAEELYQQAITFIQKVLGKHHPKVGSLLYSLGILHTSKGNIKQAEEFTKKALEVFSITDDETELSNTEQIRKLVETGKCYLTLGTIYLNNYKIYDVAEDYLKKSLDIHQRMQQAGNRDGSTAFDIAFILNSLGKISEEKQLHEEALNYYQKSYMIANGIQEGNNHVVATSLMNIGRLFVIKGDYEEAAKQFVASYKAFDASFPTQYHPDVGDLCLELGKVYLILNKNVMAKRKLEEARDVYLGYEHPTSKKIDIVFEQLKIATARVAEELEQRLANKGNLTKKELDKLQSDVDEEEHKNKDSAVREKLVTLKRKQLAMEQTK
ncbi:hypothetical protein ABK040_001244 [Willaertia magna]